MKGIKWHKLSMFPKEVQNYHFGPSITNNEQPNLGARNAEDADIFVHPARLN